VSRSTRTSKRTGVFIVDYTRSSTNVGDTVIARYRAAPLADVADRTSGQTLLTIHQPQANHNGGLVKFGPDGLLYIGMGDGGAGGDVGTGHAPQGNGQSLTTLLGKLLRIQVGATGPYTVPSGNPNLGAGTRREIWAYGLRNPWRFSFDRATGDLFHRGVRTERLGGDRLPIQNCSRRGQLWLAVMGSDPPLPLRDATSGRP